MSAPPLAAKGADILAQKIKEETLFDDIPTVENVPGSCAVSQCRSGAEIPIELYRPSPKFVPPVLKIRNGFGRAWSSY